MHEISFLAPLQEQDTFVSRQTIKFQGVRVVVFLCGISLSVSIRAKKKKMEDQAILPILRLDVTTGITRVTELINGAKTTPAIG